VWIVDSERGIRKLLKMDVDGIITSRPDRAKWILSSKFKI
jgi:glycerophosphoryl diester phosphodiesterase